MTHFEEVIKRLHELGGCGTIQITIDKQSESFVIEVAESYKEKGRKFYVNEGYVTACDEEQKWGDAVYFSNMPDSDKARLLHMALSEY